MSARPMPEPLAHLTTLRVGGPARTVVTATTEADLVAALEPSEPVLVLGGGSNVVVSDDGFDGRVVHVATRGVDVLACDACGGVLVRVAAGEPWDDVVARAVDEGWVGIEALSGIPGSTGATPLQNVGAYGQEVAASVARVRTYDRVSRAVRTFANADCAFAYRTSRFRSVERYTVLDVTFQLRPGTLSEPVRYAELASTLEVDAGERVPLPAVRAAVLALRRRKGMVLEDADHDTWSTGSFFVNPVVDEAPDGAPTWPAADGLKTSAAWLIERAGFGRGYPGPGHDVTLSTKHTLAITNRGSGTAAQVVGLAREIRDGVHRRFGIWLEPEPVLVGLSL